MKKKLFVVLIILLVVFGCSKKEVAVNEPNEVISTIESTQQKAINIVETTSHYVDVDSLSLNEQEEMFEKYIGLLGGDEPIMYIQYINEVKEKGQYHKFNFGKDGDMTTQDIVISYEEFLPKILKEIREAHPDIDMMDNEDYKFISSFLNLADFGSTEVAFLDCDNGIWWNNLTGVFGNEDEKKAAYLKFSNIDGLKEQGEYLKSLRKDLEARIEKNKEIIDQYLNDIMKLLYGQDVEKYEIKNFGITKIDDRDTRFNYVLGNKITPEIKEYYFVEDSVKGYIENGKFVRDLNPIWGDDEWGLEPESVKRGFILQGSKDYYENGLSNFKDEDIVNDPSSDIIRNSLKESPFVASSKASYILDEKDKFPEIDIEGLKNNITSELPVCRRVVRWTIE